MACCALIIGPMIAMGRLDLAMPTLNSLGVVGFTVFVKRSLARRAWFWLVILAAAALHLPLIFWVPWGTRWVPAFVVAGIDSLDFCLILYAIDAIGKIIGESARASR